MLHAYSIDHPAPHDLGDLLSYAHRIIPILDWDWFHDPLLTCESLSALDSARNTAPAYRRQMKWIEGSILGSGCGFCRLCCARVRAWAARSTA